MKTFKLLLASVLFLTISHIGFAQEKSDKFNVSGECGMCKKKIEKAAKAAGASYASWNADSKIIEVKYNAGSSDKAKIEKAIAAAGYDTQDVKASEEAYNKLDDCCKYDRTAASSADHKCCDDAKCDMSKCMKDGKCNKDMSCCKEAGCTTKDCCKKA